MNRKNNKQEDAWISEGKQAALEGKPDTECPYSYEIMARAAWFIGWQRGGGDLKTGQALPIAPYLTKKVVLSPEDEAALVNAGTVGRQLEATIAEKLKLQAERNDAVREIETCRKCWDDFTAEVCSVLPAMKNAPLFSMAATIVAEITKLRTALQITDTLCDTPAEQQIKTKP